MKERTRPLPAAHDGASSAARSALVRASACRIVTQDGANAPGFARERLRAAEQAGDRHEIEVWQDIAAAVDALLRRRRV